MLLTLYKVPSFDSVDDFLQKVATVRGKLKKGGIVDVDAAARIVLHDWNEGMHYHIFFPSFQQFNMDCDHTTFLVLKLAKFALSESILVSLFHISLCFPR